LNFVSFLSIVFLGTPALNQGIVLDLQYLPGLEYFAAMLRHRPALMAEDEWYQKQTWRNRCQIVTAQGVQTLIVPVMEGRSKLRYRDARIEYRQKWMNQHRRAIRTAYGKAPFFDHYWDALDDVYSRQPAFLFDFNWELLTICLKMLKQAGLAQRVQSSEWVDTEGILWAPGLISPKTSFVERPFYKPVPYRQVFGSLTGESVRDSNRGQTRESVQGTSVREQFFPNASILDLLFCQGPQAIAILSQSSPE
jgi:hypothetical protein